jgi:hypothetical protein
MLFCEGREIGAGIYRWGSKTSCWAELFCAGPVEPPLGPVQPPQDRLADYGSDWSTSPDTG